jgi:proteasome beta subunit
MDSNLNTKRSCVKEFMASDELKSRIRTRLGTISPNAIQNIKTGLSTGTAICAFKYRDGVMVAADRQVTGGRKIVGANAKKIETVGPYSLMAATGLVAMIQLIYDIYNDSRSFFCSRTGTEPSIRTQVKILKSLLREVWFAFGDTASSFIFCGYDVESDRKFIIQLDECSTAMDIFAAAGSGGRDAGAVLDEFFRTHVPEEVDVTDALRLALRAQRRAGSEDPYVSHPLLAVPTVMVINKGGVTELDDETVMLAYEKIDAERSVRRGNSRKP